MKIKSHKTKLIYKNDDLFKIITDSIDTIPEESVLVVTSKIISITQGNLVEITDEPRVEGQPPDKTQKHNLVRQEADYYLEPNMSKYNLMVTITNQIIAVNAGLDESNADGYYLLWPKNVQQAANDIWEFAREHYGVKKLGVIITDSKTTPLRWGVVGTAIAHCGFKALYSYIGKEDLFGKKFEMEQLSIMETLASFAVLDMGEGDERTPLAVIEDIKKIVFQDHVPTQQELDELILEIEDDVYAPFLNAVEWQKKKPK